MFKRFLVLLSEGKVTCLVFVNQGRLCASSIGSLPKSESDKHNQIAQKVGCKPRFTEYDMECKMADQ